LRAAESIQSALTFEQQADLLLERGLVANRDELLNRLRSVSYYRLSGYWSPFRRPDGLFRQGTTLHTIWRRYNFDRRLRLLVLDAIERVEVCLRAEVVQQLVQAQGQFGSCEPSMAFFFQEHDSDHGDHRYWTITELMTFGTLLTLFRGCPGSVRQEVGGRFGVADNVLESWLRTLNGVRNLCAHHRLLWNRELDCRPIFPWKDSRWRKPVEVSRNRVFGALTILKYLLDDIAPGSGWARRLGGLLCEYPEIPRLPMGYPDGWERCPIWAKKRDGCQAEPGGNK
jgi:abortive infection bacteriophage resistance protein